MVHDDPAVREVVDVLLANTRGACDHSVGPDLIREIIVNGAGGTIHAGDAHTVEENILLVDRARKAAFGQNLATGTKPVLGSRRFFHPRSVGIVIVGYTCIGSDSVLSVMGGRVAIAVV